MDSVHCAPMRLYVDEMAMRGGRDCCGLRSHSFIRTSKAIFIRGVVVVQYNVVGNCFPVGFGSCIYPETSPAKIRQCADLVEHFFGYYHLEVFL